MILPPYLKKGDTIGIVAPAGYMAVENMQSCIAALEEWGYNVRLGQTTHSASENYFSGTDKERLEDLQLMLDDRSVHAVLCARGGYGMSRIVDDISFKKFRKHPKWLIGFSDITVLLAHIYSRYKIAGLHAPMAAAFNDGGCSNHYVLSLKSALEGHTAEYEVNGHHLNREGNANGTLVGGNLALLAHIIGSRSDFNTRNKILFIEDIGEYLYNIDRMLLQMKRAGKLDKLAALVVGGFTDNKDTTRPFGQTVHEIIHHHVSDYDYPVCFDFPVSHNKENYALKTGVVHSLKVKTNYVVLSEQGHDQ